MQLYGVSYKIMALVDIQPFTEIPSLFDDIIFRRARWRPHIFLL